MPVAGGWYDQHPDFVADVNQFFSMKAVHEAKEREERERKDEAERRGMSSKTRRR